jgi:phosphatidylglycerophosphatase A
MVAGGKIIVRRERTLTFKENGYMGFLIKAAASGLGTGYSPAASGTAGSLLALVIWWFMPENTTVKLTAVSLALIVSVPVSAEAEILYGKKDDSKIVIDEIVGMWISLIFLPHSVRYFALAFALFRIFDVIKPFGIRKLQALKGGWGIVADDFLAGILANIFVRLLSYISGLT